MKAKCLDVIMMLLAWPASSSTYRERAIELGAQLQQLLA